MKIKWVLRDVKSKKFVEASVGDSMYYCSVSAIEDATLMSREDAEETADYLQYFDEFDEERTLEAVKVEVVIKEAV